MIMLTSKFVIVDLKESVKKTLKNYVLLFSLKDVIPGLSPLLFRKLSNPDIFSSTGKAKLQRQLSQDDSKLRRGSLANSLSGKQLLPLSSSVHSSVGQATWQSSGEASNLVRMRNQSLGQSAPSLTAGLKELSLPRRGSL
ncbi:PREDICTED: microtubule-associated serine/threonine-protein kinase 2-like [Myotis brandtii]|uniref:microtubule-associated serine/threonine-protein kinase 2-like n=1 Tax=Myotis brandtii TaxID=109478 RepID=UPI0007040CF2|nr:PREDICTED: microtubule-associated serine/threonine-protein kinase 2-like [Myotis brandtii]